MEAAVAIMGAAGLAIVVVLVVMRKRIGELNAAFWLVVLGAVILLAEHPQFAIAYGAQKIYPESQELVLLPHARIHFIMAGIYAIIALGLLVWVGHTFLRAGSKRAWYMLLAALLIGGGLDLFLGGSLYQHGSPLYALLGIQEQQGFGWQFLYVYVVAWASALAVSYRPIFATDGEASKGAA